MHEISRNGRKRRGGIPRHGSHRAGLGVALAIGALLVAALVLAEVGAQERALLARTNLRSSVPEQFHATILASRGAAPRPLRVEVWRGGHDTMLVRVLDSTQAGRFMLQLGAEHYLLAPGARQPVKLGSGVAAAGGLSADQLLGIDVVKDFDIERCEASGRIATFYLKAKPGTEAARTTPRARWVVDQTSELPLRVDIVLGDGRTARVVEFAAFLPGRDRVPSRLVLKDVLRGGAPVTLEVETFEVVRVPDGLFSLTDGAVRTALPPPAPPP
jgi:hypothetical protein